MLTEICDFLHNYFDRDQPKFYGGFRIVCGEIVSFNDGDMGLKDGQYYRIIGSTFNDGVWKNGCNCNFNKMQDEDFNGAVWLMAVPPDLIALLPEIEKWVEKYGGADSAALSPYNSESFGGYSYSKSDGRTGVSGEVGDGNWKSAFQGRLMRWKKI